MVALEAAWTIISALFALGFVLLLAYVTIKWMSTKMTGHKTSRIIKVIDRVAIGQDKFLLVVQVGEQTMLIGMSGDSVVKLSDLPETFSLDEWQPSADGTPDFAEVLKKTVTDSIGKLRKKESEPE